MCPRCYCIQYYIIMCFKRTQSHKQSVWLRIQQYAIRQLTFYKLFFALPSSLPFNAAIRNRHKTFRFSTKSLPLPTKAAHNLFQAFLFNFIRPKTDSDEWYIYYWAAERTMEEKNEHKLAVIICVDKFQTWNFSVCLIFGCFAVAVVARAAARLLFSDK